MQLKLGEMALDKVACLEINFKKKIVDFGDPARPRSMLLCFDRIYVTTSLAFIRIGELADLKARACRRSRFISNLRSGESRQGVWVNDKLRGL